MTSFLISMLLLFTQANEIAYEVKDVPVCDKHGEWHLLTIKVSSTVEMDKLDGSLWVWTWKDGLPRPFWLFVDNSGSAGLGRGGVASRLDNWGDLIRLKRRVYLYLDYEDVGLCDPVLWFDIDAWGFRSEKKES